MTNVYQTRFVSTADGVSSAVTSIPHVRHLHFQQIHTLLSLPPRTAGVNECACLSSLIVNETLTQMQHGQIFTGFMADKSAILRGVLG